MVGIRLNNYRRLSGYLGKSCPAVAMDSIAWIAKMVYEGDGGDVSIIRV